MTNFLKYLFKTIIVVGGLFLLFSSLQVLASTPPQASNGNSGSLGYLNLTGYDCFFKQATGCNKPIYDDLIIFLQNISLPLATLFIMFGGFEWINDKDVKKTSASATIFAAIAGYIVINLAPLIVSVITKSIDQENGFNPTAIIALLDNLIDFGLNISTVFCVVCLVIAGYSYYVEYFWNERRSNDKLAPTELIYGAIGGLVVITLARPMIWFIKSIFQVDNNTLIFQNQPIVNLIQNFLVRFAIPLSSIFAVVFLVVAGYFWMTANGDEKRVAASQNMVRNAVIGLVIVLLCTTIVQLITFFIKPVENFLPPSDPNPSQTTPPANTPVLNDEVDIP
jgi:hypothetical protein